MDIAKSFTYMFEDPEWVRKLVIGTIVTLIGLIFSVILIGLVPLIMVVGYGLLVTRNVMDGQVHPLPEWQEWVDLFVRGLKLAIVLFVWSLPLMIAIVVATIPGALAGAAQNGSGGDALGAIGGLFAACCGCLALIWGLVVALFTPAIYVHMARTNNFGAGFAFAELWAFTRNNLTNVIVALLLTWVASLIASVVIPLGFFALIIGILVTWPLATLWVILVESHLFGQVGAAAMLPTATPVSPNPPAEPLS
jgi:hypothetical protein